MHIISTNISKIKTVEHNGKKVKTGIFKTPTNEPVVIEKLNIIGDEQADLVNLHILSSFDHPIALTLIAYSH